jgi:hypothetical protein
MGLVECVVDYARTQGHCPALCPGANECPTHECIRRKLARARFLANSVKWQYFLHGRWVLSAGAPEEIRTPDPQIRSLVGPVEIIEVRYRKGGPSLPILSVFDVLLQGALPN